MFSKFQFIILLFLTLTIDSSATIYKNWYIYNNTSSTAIIKSIYHINRNEYINSLHSNNYKDTFINGSKKGKKAWNNRKDKIIRWSMKYTEDFVIMISINSTYSYRYLIYTSGDNNGNLYFGLGKNIIDGRWHTITRNLEEDLHKFEPQNTILSVNAFLIRGNGTISNIELLNNIKPQKKEIIKPQRTVESYEDNNKTTKINIMPQIIFGKGDIIYHKLGIPYIDTNVSAIDYQGNPLDIECYGEVNINRVGKYILTYMVTDKQHNTTIETRTVMVYKNGVAEKKEKSPPIQHHKNKKTIPQNRQKEDMSNFINYYD